MIFFKLVVLSSLVLLLGCQSWKIETRPGTRPAPSEEQIQKDGSKPEDSSGVMIQDSPTYTAPKEVIAPKTAVPSGPKIGIIFGPGLTYVYSQIGVMQELHRAKMPVHAVAGLEWGSLIGALYAQKEQPNDVEWQMSKLDPDVLSPSGSFFSANKGKNLTEITDFLDEAFKSAKLEDLQLSFSCLSLDLIRRQYFWNKKGDVRQTLPYCLASSPLFSPYRNQVSGVDIKLAADMLKSKGAEYIILINTLPLAASPLPAGSDPRDETLWSLHQIHTSRAAQFVNYVITVSPPPGKILDAGDRRQLIKLGRDAGALAAGKLSAKLGF